MRLRLGFTLVEMMITVAIMGIAASIIMPALSNTDYSVVQAGASLMVADFDFAQTMAISDPTDMTVVKFDTNNARWWVAPYSTPDTPFVKPYSTETYDTTMGAGRAYLATGVTFSLTDVTNNMIVYNAFGQLNQATNPVITLTYGSASGTILFDSETGFLKVK